MGITEAEDRMLDDLEYKHLPITTRQGIRKRRQKGEAVEPAFAVKEFAVACIGPFGWFIRPDYFSYKTSGKT